MTGTSLVSHLCLIVSFDLIFIGYVFFPFGARTVGVSIPEFFSLSASQSVSSILFGPANLSSEFGPLIICLLGF